MRNRTAATISLQSRQDRTTRALYLLLQKRSDLRGVYAPADHLAETLRWSA